MKRPNREQLCGYSLSEFKQFLRKQNHKVPRNLASTGYVTLKGDRMFRWRWWSDDGFVVDRSEPLEIFDRWANSTEQTYSFKSSYKGKGEQ